ncbi:MAG TPA: acyl carrier protein [Coleofasciculaceae cyanobacterium]|jgi:acyl carrier protein
MWKIKITEHIFSKKRSTIILDKILPYREQAALNSLLYQSGDIKMFELFVEIKKVLIEKLAVEPESVSLNSHIINDLGADDLDLAELIIELEEKFEIKMPNNVSTYIGSNYWSSDCFSNPMSGNVKKLFDFISNAIFEN